MFGIYSSNHNQGLLNQGLVDSFFASLLIFIPFSMMEIKSLLDVFRMHEYGRWRNIEEGRVRKREEEREEGRGIENNREEDK